MAQLVQDLNDNSKTNNDAKDDVDNTEELQDD